MLNTILSIDFLKMPLWDAEDVPAFIFRFGIHFGILLIIVMRLYYQSSKRRDYLFTYLLISTIIFMLCYMLENVKLELGMALGLFAVFGIIRYRTSQIPIKEMTYLFIVIALAVINALANKKISLAELIFANSIILAITYILERVWTIEHISRKVVQYDKINLIRPEKYSELLEDLQSRLGIEISKVDVGKVDFLRDTAKLVVYYKSQNQISNMADDIEAFIPDRDEN
ncbi:MAG: DUF4956 domain-containing protein [Bacteroidales bacterium]|nr:DUF4956 domain-containing protein [Bacteroidales bacterium]